MEHGVMTGVPNNNSILCLFRVCIKWRTKSFCAASFYVQQFWNFQDNMKFDLLTDFPVVVMIGWIKCELFLQIDSETNSDY